MNRIFIPTRIAEDWQQFLADPEKQWKIGYSARALACCWQEARGFPPEIEDLFRNSVFLRLHNTSLLFAFPEYKVPIPGGVRSSQTDLYALAKDGYGDLVSIMVEGKVSESFGPTIEQWMTPETKGKRKRLEFILRLLEFEKELPPKIRYQLLHRTASALIEADRVGAKTAMMLVHSFSQDCLWFNDFHTFVGLFGKAAEQGKLIYVGQKSGIDLYLGWVKGNPIYLSK